MFQNFELGKEGQTLSSSTEQVVISREHRDQFTILRDKVINRQQNLALKLWPRPIIVVDRILSDLVYFADSIMLVSCICRCFRTIAMRSVMRKPFRRFAVAWKRVINRAKEFVRTIDFKGDRMNLSDHHCPVCKKFIHCTDKRTLNQKHFTLEREIWCLLSPVMESVAENYRPLRDRLELS